MSLRLTQRVEQIQTAATRLVWLYALCWFAATVVAIIAGLGLIDFLVRPHDPIFRWSLSATALGLLLFSIWRLAWPALQFRQTFAGTARRIELHFPQLGERLSSAVAFLSAAPDDPTAGSLDLRRAVVGEAEAISADLDFREALDRRVTRRALEAAAAALVLAGLLIVWSPSAARLAVVRLAKPWRTLSWPRRHELVIVNAPQRVANGDDVEIAIEDRHGSLPDDVEIVLRQETSSGWRTETRPMKPLGQRAVYRLDNVTRSFEYRARGGDDDTMPWTAMSVVEPPKILKFEVVVQPPTYTGLAQRTEGRLVKALVGSQLRLTGTLDHPIRSAAAKTPTQDFPLPSVQVAAEGQQFSAPPRGVTWIVERSGSFTLELTDQHGLTFGRDTRIEVQAVQDAPPSIAWEVPGEHSFVTAHARVPIRAAVNDDLALQRIELRYLRPGSSDEEQVALLYAGPSSLAPLMTATTEGESRRIDFDWDLSGLAGLAAGDVLAVRITAEDYKPQLATTTVRRLTIITRQELENRVATRLAAILSQLADALRWEQESREKTQSLEIRAAEAGQLMAGDINLLEAAHYNHRQVERLLGGTTEGAEGQIGAVLAELTANHADAQASGQRLKELLEQVRQLNQGLVPAIEHALAGALKSTHDAGVANVPANQTRRQLHAAGAQQEQAISALEKMVGTLTQWDNLSRIAREIGQIRGEQEQLAANTDELKLRFASGAIERLPADRAAARQHAQRQLELGRRFDKLQSRMEELLTRLTAEDPLAASALADATSTAARLAIGQQMRQAASRLSQLQPGQARETQQQALDALAELLETLSTRRDLELARRLDALREALEAVHEAARRGAAIQAGLAGADSLATRPAERERLRRELEQLSQSAEQLKRRLARLQAQEAAASLGEAAEGASSAARAAGESDAARAREQADETRQQLEAAERQLAQAIAEAEAELEGEQLTRIEQMLAAIAVRQRNVITETERLEAARDNEGRLEASQQAALNNVAAEQRLLSDETEQARPRIASEAFRFALEGVTDQMRRAGVLLSRGQTAKAVQDTERAALARLEQFLTALRTEPPKETAPAASGQDGSSQQGSSNQRASTAELRLLKLLQVAINDRTAELENLRVTSGRLTGDQEQELEALAREQGRLADMVLGLIRVKEAEDRERGKSDGNQGSGVGGQESGVHAVLASQVAPRATAKPPAKSRSLDQQLLDELDRELLKGLSGPAKSDSRGQKAGASEERPKDKGTAPDAESQNPLASVAEKMRAVESRMARRETSPEIQEQQRQIVAELDALLEAAKQARQESSGKKGGSAQAGAGTGETAAAPARDSTNRIERGTKEQTETADVKDMLRRIWGHLPDKMREQMQDTLSEQFLPKYERVIEEYYKRLAEERPGGP